MLWDTFRHSHMTYGWTMTIDWPLFPALVWFLNNLYNIQWRTSIASNLDKSYSENYSAYDCQHMISNMVLLIIWVWKFLIYIYRFSLPITIQFVKTSYTIIMWGDTKKNKIVSNIIVRINDLNKSNYISYILNLS